MVTKKMFDTNKNVTKMGVITKMVYCIWSVEVRIYHTFIVLEFFFLDVLVWIIT
jgi:hypothetical protein